MNSKSGECWTEFNTTGTCTTLKEFGCFRTVLSAEYSIPEGDSYRNRFIHSYKSEQKATSTLSMAALKFKLNVLFCK